MAENRKNEEQSETQETGKYMSSVKVGPKGQIVIPIEARKMFNIQPGDTLLLLADVNRGIAVQRQDYFDKIADEIFLRADDDSVASQEKEAGLRFAKAIRNAQMTEEEDGE